jgi:hypothetical protein
LVQKLAVMIHVHVAVERNTKLATEGMRINKI